MNNYHLFSLLFAIINVISSKSFIKLEKESKEKQSFDSLINKELFSKASKIGVPFWNFEERK